jgi:nitrite reductase/ring-hydroxylating ferredoxin subunit
MTGACGSSETTGSSATTSTSSSSSGGGAGGSGGSGGAGGQGGSGGAPCGVGELAGNPTEFTANGLYRITGKSFLIGKDAGGYYAMTALCTHKLCNMNKFGAMKAANTQIECTCHGSVFDANGAALSGLAKQPLKHFALAVGCDMALYVDTGTVVDAATRLTLP